MYRVLSLKFGEGRNRIWVFESLRERIATLEFSEAAAHTVLQLLSCVFTLGQGRQVLKDGS